MIIMLSCYIIYWGLIGRVLLQATSNNEDYKDYDVNWATKRRAGGVVTRDTGYSIIFFVLQFYRLPYYCSVYTVQVHYTSKDNVYKLLRVNISACYIELSFVVYKLFDSGLECYTID